MTETTERGVPSHRGRRWGATLVLLVVLAAAPACGGRGGGAAVEPTAVGGVHGPGAPARRTAPGPGHGGASPRFTPLVHEGVGEVADGPDPAPPAEVPGAGAVTAAAAGSALARASGHHAGVVSDRTDVPEEQAAAGAPATGRPAWTGPGRLTSARPGGKG